MDNGDTLFKSQGVNHSLADYEVPTLVKIENCQIGITFLQHYSDLLYCNLRYCHLLLNHKLLTSAEIGNGAVFTCTGFSFTLIWRKNTIYVFDAHCRDSEGTDVPNGPAVLLEFKTLNALNSYLMKYYEKYFLNKQVFQFDTQYITIELSEDTFNSVLATLKKNSLKDLQIRAA